MLLFFCSRRNSPRPLTKHDCAAVGRVRCGGGGASSSTRGRAAGSARRRRRRSPRSAPPPGARRRPARRGAPLRHPHLHLICIALYRLLQKIGTPARVRSTGPSARSTSNFFFSLSLVSAGRHRFASSARAGGRRATGVGTGRGEGPSERVSRPPAAHTARAPHTARRNASSFFASFLERERKKCENFSRVNHPLRACGAAGLVREGAGGTVWRAGTAVPEWACCRARPAPPARRTANVAPLFCERREKKFVIFFFLFISLSSLVRAWSRPSHTRVGGADWSLLHPPRLYQTTPQSDCLHALAFAFSLRRLPTSADFPPSSLADVGRSTPHKNMKTVPLMERPPSIMVKVV